MRSRYCKVCKDFHDIEQPWPTACLGHFAPKGTDPRFYVIRDQIDPFLSHGDNLIYDSKSQYRKALKAQGLVELGNEKITFKPQKLPPVGPDIKRAIEQLKSGNHG